MPKEKDQRIHLFGPLNDCSTGKSSTDQRYEYIPIDFIKSELLDMDISCLLNNPLLNFTREINEQTGELKNGKIAPRIAEYKNLKFTLYDNGKLYLSGSLHKFSNCGLHNFNDFTIEDFNTVISNLKTEFSITPVQIRIQTLEYGFNIISPYDTSKILENCLVHNGKNIIDCIPNSDGKYKQVRHQKYTFKLYDKAKQYQRKGYSIPHNLMRIEIKQTNWSEYRGKGIYTLQDFIKADKLPFLNNLLDHWESIVFYDPTNPPNPKMYKYSNVLYWNELKRTKNRSTYHRNIKRLNELNKTGMNIKGQVEELIRDKMNQFNLT